MSDSVPQSDVESPRVEKDRPTTSRGWEVPSVPIGVQLYNLFLSLRPHQWTKNLVVFAALVFVPRLHHLPSVVAAVGAFGLFCLLSGAVYLVNDLLDLERDRLHPVKRQRPLAAGLLSPSLAKGAAVVIVLAALGGSFALGTYFGLVALVYIGLMTGYSFVLKNVVILDVLTVSFAFVLRAVAGAVAIEVVFSNWLLIVTMLLALFLTLSKRRHEFTLLAGEAAGHRRILGEYSPYLLDQMIAVVTASTVVSYALYTQAPETVSKFGTDRLVWTLPFVLYGIFRYLYLVHQRDEGGNPSRVLLNDRPILAAVALWTVAVVTIIYHFGESG